MSLSAQVHDLLKNVLRKLDLVFASGGTGLIIDPESAGYDDPKAFTLTIESGEALSDTLIVPSPVPLGWAVEFPNAWTAANLGVDGSDDNSNWVPIRDEFGNRVKITGIITNAVASYRLPIEAMQVGAFAYLRLASLDASDDSAENQLGERSLKVKAFC